MTAPVVTRFAPSPTGELHLGNARTALFSLLLARHRHGRFILRIEDTDTQRSREQFIDALIEDLRWLGLDWDEGPLVGGPAAPYFQSQRSEHYERGFAELEERNLTYPCFCAPLELEMSRKAQLAAGQPPRYAGTCRDLTGVQRAAKLAQGLKPTLRFRVPSAQQIAFDDIVHGPQRFASDDIGDFIIRRADGSAAFFFSNALDDAAMQVTHVLRGEDHLANTPRQLLVLAALGRAQPSYGHVSLLVGTDGAPLSKRQGAQSIRQLREAGFLPQAIVNQLFRLGHSGGPDGLCSLSEMARHFDVQHLGRAPSRFDEAQLRSWQKHSAHALSLEASSAWLESHRAPGVDTARWRAFIEAVRANVVLPPDLDVWTEVVFGPAPPLDAAGTSLVRDAGPEFFAQAVRATDALPGDWQALVAAVRAATGRKGPALFKPLRYALTGREQGPELAPLLRLIEPRSVHERLARFAS